MSDVDAGTGAAAGSPGDAASGDGGGAAAPSGDDRLPDADRVAVLLQWALLAALVLFGLAAAVGLYANVTRLIELWIVEEYRPAAAAGFNLVVLLVAALGVSRLLGRLRE